MAAASHAVLVVDDDKDLRTTLAHVLADEGYRLLEAANGKEALEKLRSGERPDVILLDLMMPLMNGAQFRRVQLEDPALASIPVVVMTAAGGRALASIADLAPSQVLEKPVGLDALLQAIDAAIGD